MIASSGYNSGGRSILPADRRNTGSLILLLPSGCLVVLLGALIAGLSLDVPANASSWKLRVKVVALSGAFGGGLGGTIGMCAVLLTAIVLARSLGGVPGLTVAVRGVAAWLLVVVLLSTIADISSFGDTGGAGYVSGQLAADCGTLVVIAGTAVMAAASRADFE